MRSVKLKRLSPSFTAKLLAEKTSGAVVVFGSAVVLDELLVVWLPVELLELLELVVVLPITVVVEVVPLVVVEDVAVLRFS